MSLHVGRVTYSNEFLTCKVSRQIIGYGDFYFWDDTDPDFVVKASEWQTWREYWKYQDWDMKLLNGYTSDRDYHNQLLQIQRQLYVNTMDTDSIPRFDQVQY